VSAVILTTEEKLVAAVEKLREVAKQCSDCGGTGVITHLDPMGSDYDRKDYCAACADIHAVITVCTT
jgi:hypothetical protein